MQINCFKIQIVRSFFANQSTSLLQACIKNTGTVYKILNTWEAYNNWINVKAVVELIG